MNSNFQMFDKIETFTHWFLGDELLRSHLKDQEDLSMEMVYTVIDRYREAMVLSREIEVGASQ